MLEQIPDIETQNNRKTQPNNRRRRKKKFSTNQKSSRKNIKERNPKLASTMSTWAENFTVAATWQLKHQIAYWKAKAKALEYENQVLHGIIRNNNFLEDSSADNTSHPGTEEQADNVHSETEAYEDPQEEMDFEVSEEFIQFLAKNVKYKEEARRERELLRLKNEEAESKEIQEEHQETSEEKCEKLKRLYGKHWQRISAIEMTLQSQFIHDTDKCNPIYWPNIPFNFTVG